VASPQRRHLSSRGFTLIEVLAAAFVMTVAIGSSLIVLGRGFASLDSARCVSYASQIMQSEFEKMRLTTWTDVRTNYSPGVDADHATVADVTIDPAYFNVGDVGSRMTMKRSAYWAPGHDGVTGDHEVVLVKLTIEWSTRDRRTLHRSYVTYYGMAGLYDYFIL